MLENTENKNNTKAMERFFCNNNKGAFLFVVGNDERVRNNILDKNKLLTKAKNVTIETFSFHKNFDKNQSLLRNLIGFLKNNKADGLVLIDLEYLLLNEIETEEILTQINFSREALLELNIPILFWIKAETTTKFANQAADIYNQRGSSNLYFDYGFSKDSEMATDGYLMEKTAANNTSIAKHNSRIKLLTEQLEQAKELKIDKLKIANDIVINLLEIYVEIPNAEKPIQNLLNAYKNYFYLKETRNCFILGRAYQSINQFNESEKLYHRALKKCRILAKSNPHKFLPNLASTLNNLGILQSYKNDYDAAELSYKEALEIRRILAKSNPDTYSPDVASTLNNLGVLQKNKNDYAAADLSYKEALEIRRILAKSNPNTYLPDVAITINNLGILQSYKNDYVAAEINFNEALEIRRTLAKSNPDSYLPVFASTLNNLGVLQKNNNDYVAADLSYKEALEIRRILAKSNPDTYLPDVAMTLNNIGVLQQNKNDYAAADLSYKEALEIRRILAKSNPDTYLPVVAMTLNNKARLYTEFLVDKEKSVALVNEAIRILIAYISIEYCQNYLKKSLNVLNHWDIDVKTYLKENFPKNPELLDFV